MNEVEGDTFGVNIIPHTAAVTGFGTSQPGDPVNIEIDMLARYVARLAETRHECQTRKDALAITELSKYLSAPRN